MKASSRLQAGTSRRIERPTTMRSGNFCARHASCQGPSAFRRPEDAAMHLSNESLIVILLVGLVAGWLAGQIVEGTGFGLLGDLLIGIVGAFIGNWLLPRLGVHLGAGIVAAIVNATIGAVVLLLIV